MRAPGGAVFWAPSRMRGVGPRVSTRTISATSPTKEWATAASARFAPHGAVRESVNAIVKHRRAPMNENVIRDAGAAPAPARPVIAGVSVPDGPLIAAAIEYAQRLSEPYLFHHAMRSWLFAELIGR